MVQDDRDRSRYAVAEPWPAARRSRRPQAFASASSLGTLPRTEASSARACAARSAYSAWVGRPSARLYWA
nr:hypothetical protein OG546_49460 [Streptomyces antimycoticus]